MLGDVKRVLEELHQVTVRIDYFAVDDDDVDADDTGTADTLQMMRDKIKVGFVTKCEVLTSFLCTVVHVSIARLLVCRAVGQRALSVSLLLSCSVCSLSSRSGQSCSRLRSSELVMYCMVIL